MEKNLSAKIKELDRQVEWFDSDDFSLDAASQKYKAALELATEIEGDLKGLKNEIEVLNEDFTKDV